jgi:thiol-disulfide isomerase/thioredoxin
MPHIIARDTLGNKVLFDTLQASAVFVNIWGTWCPPCIKDIPFVNRLDSLMHNHKDIRIINLCVQSKFLEWKKVISGHSLTGLNLIIEDDASFDSLESVLKFNGRGAPYFVILNGKNKIMGTGLDPDQGLLLAYALIQARNDISIKESIQKFIRLMKDMKHKDNPETKEFISFLSEFEASTKNS